MKNIIILILSCIFLTTCASRKVKKSKVETKKSEILQLDSSSVDKTKKTSEETQKSNVKTNAQETVIKWKYVAPASVFPDLKPIWLNIGSDSVDVSKLPPGASLEANNESRSKRTDSIGMLTKRDEEIRDLKKQLSARQEKREEFRAEAKEVAKVGFTWWLLAIGILIGLFAPTIWRYGFTFIKKLILKI